MCAIGNNRRRKNLHLDTCKRSSVPDLKSNPNSVNLVEIAKGTNREASRVRGPPFKLDSGPVLEYQRLDLRIMLFGVL